MAYHDDEWGVPLHGEAALYERLTLEAFQSGLSWLTILRKRDGFRRAFAGFEPKAVAEFGDADVARLMADTSIVRNRAKIDAAIRNARAIADLDVPLDELLWSFSPGGPAAPGDAGGGPGDHAGVHGDGEGAEEAGLRVRGPDHGLRADAGDRHGRRPRGGVLARGLSPTWRGASRR